MSVHGEPLELLELEATPIHAHKQQQQSSNLTLDNLTESQCRNHIDKLKILNLVANLKAEPSPDDYDKDITVEIELENAKLMNGAVAMENGFLNKNVTEWIKEVESEQLNETSQLHDLPELPELPELHDLHKEHEVRERGIVETVDISVNTSPIALASPVKIKNGHIPYEFVVTSTPEPHNIIDAACSVLERQPTDDDVFIENKKVNNVANELTSGSDELLDKKSAKGSDSMTSSEYHTSQYSTLKRKKRNSDGCKPPNVLVYSESNDYRSTVIETIKNILHPDRYTIYELNTEQLKSSIWIDNTTLLIVCGPTSPQVGSILMEYFLCGGKMLCLCSDVLNMVLPIYRTAEVREQELVQFSYSHWQKISLMHHIFCYHQSPIKKHFSLENDDQFDSQPKP